MEKHAQILIASIFVVEDRPKELRARNSMGGDDPWEIMKAKNDFANKAMEVECLLRKCKNKDNNEITNKILIELYAIGYMLNNQITLSTERIKFYTQKMKELNLGNIDYGQLNSMVLDMEMECARAMNGEEVLQNLQKQIDIAQSQYDLAKQAVQYAKDLTFAGVWALVAGTLSGLFIMSLSAITGNVVGLGIGLTVFVGSIAVGGGIAIAGVVTVKKANEILDQRKKELDSLKSQYADTEDAIRKGALDIIKREEEKAKEALGISD